MVTQINKYDTLGWPNMLNDLYIDESISVQFNL